MDDNIKSSIEMNYLTTQFKKRKVLAMFKLYGNTVNTWYATNEDGRKVITQREIEYKAFDETTLELMADGTEDFSAERLRKTVIIKMVYVWDGHTLNRGGKRKFNFVGWITVNKADAKKAKEYFTKKYNAEIVQFRGNI